MGQRETSAVRQRRLRTELRRIREAAGHTQKTVAEALGWSTSKLIRIETGAVQISTSDLMAMLHFYRITDPESEAAMLAVTRVKESGWWDEYRGFVPQQFLTFLGYEDSAVYIRNYMTLVVPGLLQTAEYSRALIADFLKDHDQDLLDRGTQLRLRRQELFGRPNCPGLHFVLDEAVLHRWMGGPDVMLRQLTRLKELAHHPAVHLQVVPFTAGMYAGMQGTSFTIFGFSLQDGVVVLEDPGRDQILDDPEMLSSYLRTFDQLKDTACPEDELDTIIDPVIDRLRRGAIVHARDRTPRETPKQPSVARPSGRTTSSGGSPTVGIVTAIPEELVAMRAMLGAVTERHVAHDPARYVLGTVPSREAGHDHGVALTLLGATATNAAAAGCANLVRSFPSITVIIMVGIAAGVPDPARPERHVRLGDIVVATRVVDFDHIRAVEGETEQRRELSLPSPRLTHSAHLLRTDELRGHRAWEEWLDVSQHPDLVGYGRPPEHTDTLHDVTGQPVRHPRRNISGHRKDFPKVHYGLIGSSNRSLRDAAVRDELATRHGVIALEMEGAGIGSSSFLNNREWFVVRGISDYGDSHRSGLWRRHAALVAAAYVRALLARCLPLMSE
jgi:nucleoside phosphorylase/transcriptional regulator with XRE-family HTH domain